MWTEKSGQNICKEDALATIFQQNVTTFNTVDKYSETKLIKS